MPARTGYIPSMAANNNPQRARVVITLDRPRTIFFDFNAMCLLEETLGISLATTTNPMALGLRGLRAMLYAGLKSDDPEITVDRAGKFFDQYDEREITRRVLQAWGVSFDDGDPAAPLEAAANPQPPSGTGAQ